MSRRAWIGFDTGLTVTRQCELAGVARSTVYASAQRTVVDDALELLLCRLVDEEYTRHPFYGSRRMVVFLPSLPT